MRIAHLFPILVALVAVVLSSVIRIEGRLIDNSSTPAQHHHRHHARLNHHRHHHDNLSHNASLADFGRWLPPPEAQLLLRQESSLMSRGQKAGLLPAVDCCPSVVEMVEPEGGKNMDGIYVELFRDGANRQRFYEVSCKQGVEGKPCRFMDKKLHNQSRCTQKYSYSYALVKETSPREHGSGTYFPTIPGSGPGEHSWMLDYIEVRSGCSCVVYPKPRLPKKRRNRRPSRIDEDEDS